MRANGCDRWSRALVIFAMVLGLAVAAYGAYLLIVGIPWTVVPAVAPGQPLPEGTTALRTTPTGIVPLLAGLAVAIGLLAGRIWVAWAGGVMVAAFSVAFLFGVGGVLVVPAAVLLLVLVALSWPRAERARWRRDRNVTREQT